MSDRSLRVYFSFRSPYAYLALYRLSLILPRLDCDYQLLPLVPDRTFIESSGPSEQKRAYILEDLARISSAYGLQFTVPEPFDINWAVPHAAFFVADAENKGLDFALYAYHARFIEGKDLADDTVLQRLAPRCQLDAQALLTAHAKSDIQKKLLQSRHAMQQDAVFGVPTFVYNGNKFWGNDRLDWLLRDIQQSQGQSVPDLKEDVMQRVF